MVSIEKIQRGVSRYADAELLPKMDGKDKWVTTAAVALYLAKLPVLVKSIKDNEAIKILGIISEDGQSIDLDILVNSVKPAAQQCPASFKIPFGGTLSITESDIDTLRSYIMQA